MIRLALSALGGSALALALFWLLALLVMPPEEEVTPPQMALPLRLAAVAEVAQRAEEAETAPESVAEPEASEDAPAPLPESPEGNSLPEPEPEPEPRQSSSFEPAADPADTFRAEPAGKPGDGDAGRASDVADIGPVEVGEAVPLSRVPPRYPRRAQRRGLEGHVELEFLIRPDGSVDRTSIRVLDARPRRVFEAVAEEAVGEWRFEADGRLRRARQRLEFRLR